MVGAMVVVATAALGVPAASAGTYDVVSCGAPGAGGVNRAWTPVSSARSTADSSRRDPSSSTTAPELRRAGQSRAAAARALASDASWLHLGELSLPGSAWHRDHQARALAVGAGSSRQTTEV